MITEQQAKEYERKSAELSKEIKEWYDHRDKLCKQWEDVEKKLDEYNNQQRGENQ